jgi:hypothetical protein
VLIACLFWGFIWGLMGLILAMPITVSLKLVFQHVPSLHRWAELMSMDWHSPGEEATILPAPKPEAPTRVVETGAAQEKISEAARPEPAKA